MTPKEVPVHQLKPGDRVLDEGGHEDLWPVVAVAPWGDGRIDVAFEGGLVQTYHGQDLVMAEVEG